MPKASYSPVLMSGEPVDRANDFVEHCSKDNLYVAKDGKAFCTQSVFSLTTFKNNGTFPCECDTRGSRSDSCEAFGGQCSCYENIIGRTCSRCKTGYYGFPNCRSKYCVTLLHRVAQFWFVSHVSRVSQSASRVFLRVLLFPPFLKSTQGI